MAEVVLYDGVVSPAESDSRVLSGGTCVSVPRSPSGQFTPPAGTRHRDWASTHRRRSSRRSGVSARGRAPPHHPDSTRRTQCQLMVPTIQKCRRPRPD